MINYLEFYTLAIGDNFYIFVPMKILTYIVGGKEVKISAEDKDLFESRKWHLVKTRQREEKYYIATSFKRKTIYLHRMILGCTDRYQIGDHIDRDTLNYTRENLRITTQSINRINSSGKSGKVTSKYKGVFFRKNRKVNPFYSMIQQQGKPVIWIGSFDNETSAAIAYNKKHLEMFGIAAYEL